MTIFGNLNAHKRRLYREALKKLAKALVPEETVVKMRKTIENSKKRAMLRKLASVTLGGSQVHSGEHF